MRVSKLALIIHVTALLSFVKKVVSTKTSASDELYSLDRLCDNLAGLQKDTIVPVDAQSQLIINLCGIACGKSKLCLTDVHRKATIEFNQPRLSYGKERLTFFLNFASLENTLSSDGFPFIAQMRLVCEAKELDADEEEQVIQSLKPPYELDVKSPLYQLTWRSHNFCVSGMPIAPNSISYLNLGLWLGMVLSVLYFVGATLLNYFASGKRGLDMLPHAEFFAQAGRKCSEFWENLKIRLNEHYAQGGEYMRVGQSNNDTVPGGFV